MSASPMPLQFFTRQGAALRRALAGWRARDVSALTFVAALLALLFVAPILAVAISIFQSGEGAWASLMATVLPRYAVNTLLLGVLVAVGTAMVGTGAAWLVTMYRFPGRRIFEWALALPLAFPAYVLAYAYTDFLDHPGPVQSGLRALMGWGPRDYWFPEVRSLEGAALMLVLVLYPYVYLLGRAAFLQQSICALDVSRTLGANAWGVFWRVALPMARPALATGVALALMETLADFGTVAHFGVETFATGIYRAWFSMGDRVAAAQLSTCLLAFVLVLIALERTQRRAARFQANNARFSEIRSQELTGWHRWAAFGLCLAPVVLGFVLPLLVLTAMSLEGGHTLFGKRYIGYALNSLTLASIAAVLTVLVAILLAYAARLRPGPISRSANQLASLGYAVPGGVIAVGLLIPLAAFDNALDAWMREVFGISTGLLLTGSLGLLVFAYMVRFMSVALQTVEASLSKVTPSMDYAARALGETASGVLTRVHLPMLRGGLLTAGLIVFVDVMKELPATLIMRPFNFDTLAVQAYRLAADERLLQASTPSLAIVAVGLVPVLLLSREIRRSRPGSSVRSRGEKAGRGGSWRMRLRPGSQG
ncbi:MAG: iron ABC transporter permease [Neomegalonema sp.]|nr:iron ABC transporter permease [Neomegalonema sp.]